MVDNAGEALRSLREAAGLTQRGLAAKAFASKTLIGAVEKGEKALQADLAEACDRVFGTTPLLATLAAIAGGDDVRRRALLTHLGSAAVINAVAGPGGLAELVRAGLFDAAEVDHDWDELIAEYRHRLTVDGSPTFGDGLLAQLMVLRQRLHDSGGAPDLLRAVASLGQVYGLWLGNVGNLLGASGWYATASTLADRSGDRRLTSYVVGRAASRGIYEGWSVGRTLDDADRALELAGGAPCDGALEAYAAQVHVHALTGDAKAGRRAAATMREVAEQAADEAAIARALFLDAFGEARYGSVETAQRAYDAARPALGPRPLWLAEATVYLGRSMVAGGDVPGGATVALSAVRSLRDDVRVVGVAVRDLVHSAPGGATSQELDALRGYADPTPGPWETLR